MSAEELSIRIDHGSLTALIGGSFDPIHNGHLHLARELLKDPSIQELAFVPVGRHHFKRDQMILSYAQRLGLISHVLEPGMQLWEDDAQGSGYTADLIRKLQLKYPKKSFAFVIGSDNLTQLPLWRDYEWLRQNLLFIVVARPGYQGNLPEPSPRCLFPALNPPDISSSQIRSLLAKGSSIAGMVPQVIEEELIRLYGQTAMG